MPLVVTTGKAGEKEALSQETLSTWKTRPFEGRGGSYDNEYFMTEIMIKN
jgi:hypothetical protein